MCEKTLLNIFFPANKKLISIKGKKRPPGVIVSSFVFKFPCKEFRSQSVDWVCISRIFLLLLWKVPTQYIYKKKKKLKTILSV